MFIIINMIVTMMLTTVASFILYSTFYIFIKNSNTSLFKDNDISYDETIVLLLCSV